MNKSELARIEDCKLQEGEVKLGIAETTLHFNEANFWLVFLTLTLEFYLGCSNCIGDWKHVMSYRIFYLKI